MTADMPIQVEDVSSLWVAGAGFVGAILGAVISVGIPFFKDWWARPKLDIECDQATDVFDLTWEEKSNTPTEGAKKFERRYLTVRLVNNGWIAAKSVRLYFEKLEEVNGDTVGETVIRGTSFQFAWPGYIFDDRNLPPSLKLPAEIVAVDKSRTGWIFMFKTRTEHNTEKITLYKGIYRFTLVVVADNAKAKKRHLDVSYQGDWHHLKFVKIF